MGVYVGDDVLVRVRDTVHVGDDVLVNVGDAVYVEESEAEHVDDSVAVNEAGEGVFEMVGVLVAVSGGVPVGVGLAENIKSTLGGDKAEVGPEPSWPDVPKPQQRMPPEHKGNKY